MGSDQYLAVKMAAFAAGMKAKAGELAYDDVDRLGDLTVEKLDAGDPLMSAVADFVYDCNVYMRDPVKLAELGADLCRHIETLNLPQPPDLDRRDIYG
ncbi:MAG: hypothetical protein AB3N12_01560 [Ruegeria sp.]